MSSAVTSLSPPVHLAHRSFRRERADRSHWPVHPVAAAPGNGSVAVVGDLNFGCSWQVLQFFPAKVRHPDRPHTKGGKGSLLARNFSSLSAVSTSLVPVAPTGCPKAMAPPFTLTISPFISPSTFRGRVFVTNSSICMHPSQQGPEQQKPHLI